MEDAPLFKNQKTRHNIIAGTDVDGTTFYQDLGILVFLKKLQRPEFWQFTPEQFDQLLVPPKYKELLTRLVINGPDRLKAKLALDLATDITTLYRLKKRINGSVDKAEELKPVLEEFAAKMIAFDKIMMDLEKHFLAECNGQLLMRIRFFNGKTVDDVQAIVKEIIQDTIDHWDNETERKLQLKVVDGTRERGTKLTNQELEANFDAQLFIQELSLTINRAVFETLEKLGTQNGVSIRAITTNLREIAIAGLLGTRYGRILHGERTIGTTLTAKEDGTLGEELEGPAVFGAQKSVILDQFGQTRKKTPGFMAGDSLTNEGPTFINVVNRGGIATIVVADPNKLEEVINKVARDIVPKLTTETLSQNIIYSVGRHEGVPLWKGRRKPTTTTLAA